MDYILFGLGAVSEARVDAVVRERKCLWFSAVCEEQLWDPARALDSKIGGGYVQPPSDRRYGEFANTVARIVEFRSGQAPGFPDCASVVIIVYD